MQRAVWSGGHSALPANQLVRGICFSFPCLLLLMKVPAGCFGAWPRSCANGCPMPSMFSGAPPLPHPRLPATTPTVHQPCHSGLCSLPSCSLWWTGVRPAAAASPPRPACCPTSRQRTSKTASALRRWSRCGGCMCGVLVPRGASDRPGQVLRVQSNSRVTGLAWQAIVHDSRGMWHPAPLDLPNPSPSHHHHHPAGAAPAAATLRRSTS